MIDFNEPLTLQVHDLKDGRVVICLMRAPENQTEGKVGLIYPIEKNGLNAAAWAQHLMTIAHQLGQVIDVATVPVEIAKPKRKAKLIIPSQN